jgi:hypothetical protein
MVVMFLWEQGKFQRFVKLIEAKEKHGYGSYFEAALEMPLDHALPLWQTYLNDVAAQRSKLLLLPPSEIYRDERLFRGFQLIHGWRLPAGAEVKTNSVPK